MSQVYQINVYAGQHVLLQKSGLDERPLRHQLWQTLHQSSHWTYADMVNTYHQQVVLSLRRWGV